MKSLDNYIFKSVVTRAKIKKSKALAKASKLAKQVTQAGPKKAGASIPNSLNLVN